MVKKRIVKLSESRLNHINNLLNLGNSVSQTSLKSHVSERDLRKILKGDYKVVKGLRKLS